MKNLKLILAATVLLGTAVAGNVDTGTAAWSLVSCPGGQTLCSVTNLGANPSPGIWQSAIGSQWIGPSRSAPATNNNDQWALDGTYVYQLLIPASVNYMLTFGSDDTGTVAFYNGATLLSTVFTAGALNGPSTPASPLSGNIPAGADRIVVTITNNVLVNPGNPNPTGFFLAGDVTDAPEPSTFALFGLAGAAALVARKLRK